jgi:hypothetical protein
MLLFSCFGFIVKQPVILPQILNGVIIYYAKHCNRIAIFRSTTINKLFLSLLIFFAQSVKTLTRIVKLSWLLLNWNDYV